MDKLDEFLEKLGVKLLPYQKEILKHVINEEKIYVLPLTYYRKKYYFQNLLYLNQVLLSKGENNDQDRKR